MIPPSPGNQPHTIHLRGPWTTEDGRRVKLPAAWRDALGDVGRVTLARPFNRPTGLDEPGVSVFLRLASENTVEQVLLNGSELVDGSDLVGILAPSNRLSVSLARGSLDTGILEAWLEIVEL